MTRAQQQDLLVRSRNAFRVRDYDSARQLLEPLLESAPHSVTANTLMGIVAGRTGKPAEAIQRFKIAISKDKKNAEAYNNLAVTLRQMGRYDDAYTAVRTAKQLAPDRADVHYNEGNILKEMGRIEAAQAAYRRALDVNPRFVMAYNNLGTLHLASGEVSQAVDMFSQGLAIDDNHPTLRYNLALAHEEQGRLDDAREEYERSLKSRPGWTDALNNLGIIYQKQERFDEAARTFKQVVKLDKESAVARNNLATTYVMQGKHREALAFYREAIELDPSYRRAAANLGQLLENAPVDDDSTEELLQLGKLDTGNTELQLRIAAFCIRRRDLETARKTLLQVLTNEPEEIEAIRMLGEVYHRSGADEQAQQCYAKIRELDPTYGKHVLDRTLVFLEREEFEAALAEIDRYLSSHPGTLDALMLKVDALVDMGRNEEALQILNELKELYPGDGRVLAALARAHQQGGDRERAVEAASELINLQGSRATHEDIAALNESLELYEQAVEAFAPEHDEAWTENLRKLGELSRPEAEEEPSEPEPDEMNGVDEDSIPILTFGGEELLEPEEWELQVTGVDEPEEEASFGIDIPDPMAESLTNLPEESQRRSGDGAPPSNLDSHGFATEPAPPEAWSPPAQAPQSLAPPPPVSQPTTPPPQRPTQPTQPPPPPPRQSPVTPMPVPPPVEMTVPEEELVEEPVPEDDEAADDEVADEVSDEEPQDELDEALTEEPEDEEPEDEPDDEPDSLLGGAEPEPPPPEPAALPQAPEPLRTAPEDNRARLLDYLDGLANSLPNEKRQEYLQSDARLRLEYLRARMAGRPGLKHDLERYRGPDSKRPAVSITPKRVADTMGYIAKMSGYHPDAAIGTALRTRVAHMLAKLKELRGKTS